MAGWESLGSALGGGGALPAAIASAQGEQLGANTQNAIAEAQLRQQKLHALQSIGTATPAFAAGEQDPTKLGAALATFAQAGVNPGEFTTAVHGNQENNSYNQIVNPETPDDIVARHLAAEGKEGGIIRPTAAGEAATNILHPEQGVTTTPLGQAMIPAKVAQQTAQTNNLNAEARKNNAMADNGGTALKAPSGFQWAVNEDGTPKLDENGQRESTYITNGPKDPNAPGKMGANQTTQFLRTVNAARQGAADLQNVMEMPIGASTGLFGTGLAGSQGHTIGGTLAANLSNTLNGQDAQRYNVVMSGLNQNLSALETFGLAPRGSLVNSMDRLAITPSDTEFTALTKLAQARQIADSAITTHVTSNPNLTEDQKSPLRDIQASLAKAIPFTVHDINMLVNDKGGKTLADMYSKHAPPGAVGTAPPAAAPAAAAPTVPGIPGGAIPTFDSEQEAEAAGLQPGTRVIVGGRAATWQ